MTPAEHSTAPRLQVRHRAKLVALFFAAMTAWMLAPIIPDLSTHIIGDPRTDAIRGMWGLDHLRHALMEGHPFQTSRVNFPAGAYAVVLPLATGTLVAPLGATLGPVLTWNITLFLMLWGTAMGTAWLCKILTDSWLPGILAGSAVIAQPMLHHSLADGTVEHVALWSLPLFLGAAIAALQEQSIRWSLCAGILAVIVAIDSPYNAVYALVAGLMVLPWHLRWVRGRERDLIMAIAAMLLLSVAGGAGIVWLLHPLELGAADPQSSQLQMTNATDIRMWWRYTSSLDGLRDPTRPPTLIPTPIMVGAPLLCLLGGRKGLPWLLAGLVMMGLSLGLAEKTPSLLGRWLGSPASLIGDAALTLNTWAYDQPVLSSIRFPRRWLVPAAIALSIGASTGVVRILRRWPRQLKIWTVLACLVSCGLTWQGTRTSQFSTDFPQHPLPALDFATYVADSDETGAVLLLPHVRTKAKNATRDDLPVFARLSPALASADDLYLQTQHKRPIVSFPNLQTLKAEDHQKEVMRVLRDWSDLSRPKTAGQGIPPSAMSTTADLERKAGIRALREAGLRWVLIDLGAYEETGLKELERQIGLYVIDDQTFENGDGVRVLTLR